MTPVGEGRLEVYIDDDLIFDRKAAGHYPSMPDVTQMKLAVQEKAPTLSE